MKMTKKNLKEKPSVWYWGEVDSLYYINYGVIYLYIENRDIWEKSAWQPNDKSFISHWVATREFMGWL